ncbi:MAG: S4 domain-containing protein [Alcanivorax sp.]|nr:S4 domain-containing protein [Alcanivorax sp.]
MESVRIDSWLWAARFFKTRTLAKTAIEGGKVHLDGSRTKPSKAVQPGQTVTITKGTEHFEVVVEALSSKRGPAKVAQALYQETPASQARRAQSSEQRRLARAAAAAPDHRPSKKERRDIQRFKRDNDL